MSPTAFELKHTENFRQLHRREGQSAWIGIELNELGQPKSRGMQPDYLPTPDEIAEACRRIQMEWTPEERMRRTMGSHPNEVDAEVSVVG